MFAIGLRCFTADTGCTSIGVEQLYGSSRCCFLSACVLGLALTCPVEPSGRSMGTNRFTRPARHAVECSGCTLPHTAESGGLQQLVCPGTHRRGTQARRTGDRGSWRQFGQWNGHWRGLPSPAHERHANVYRRRNRHIPRWQRDLVRAEVRRDPLVPVHLRQQPDRQLQQKPHHQPLPVHRF